jgi:acyl-coenzyme A synthetase/AMP-(fatty) acid ligase
VEYVAAEKPAGAYTNILFSSGTTGIPMKRKRHHGM